MKVLKSFLQSLNDEGVGFFVVLENGPVNLDADELTSFLEDPDAWETNFEAIERERADQY